MKNPNITGMNELEMDKRWEYLRNHLIYKISGGIIWHSDYITYRSPPCG